MPFRHLPPRGAAPPEPRVILPEGGSRALRVLVADDNSDALLMLAMLLRSFGHEVKTAFDGAIALEQAAELAPDVALLDLDMPVKSGFEVARALRGDTTHAGVVLVAISGKAEPEDRAQASRAGFDHHLAKPADVEQLLRILETAAARR